MGTQPVREVCPLLVRLPLGARLWSVLTGSQLVLASTATGAGPTFPQEVVHQPQCSPTPGGGDSSRRAHGLEPGTGLAQDGCGVHQVFCPAHTS